MELIITSKSNSIQKQLTDIERIIMDLEKCPGKTCHGNAVLSEDYDEYGMKCYIIRCTKCNVKLKMRNKDELIQTWNTIVR